MSQWLWVEGSRRGKAREMLLEWSVSPADQPSIPRYTPPPYFPRFSRAGNYDRTTNRGSAGKQAARSQVNGQRLQWTPPPPPLRSNERTSESDRHRHYHRQHCRNRIAFPSSPIFLLSLASSHRRVVHVLHIQFLQRIRRDQRNQIQQRLCDLGDVQRLLLLLLMLLWRL